MATISHTSGCEILHDNRPKPSVSLRPVGRPKRIFLHMIAFRFSQVLRIAAHTRHVIKRIMSHVASRVLFNDVQDLK